MKIISNAVCLRINRFDSYGCEVRCFHLLCFILDFPLFHFNLVLVVFLSFFCRCTACAWHCSWRVLCANDLHVFEYACVCVADNNCGMHCYIVQVIHHPNVKYNKSCDHKRNLECECELRTTIPRQTCTFDMEQQQQQCTCMWNVCFFGSSTAKGAWFQHQKLWKPCNILCIVTATSPKAAAAALATAIKEKTHTKSLVFYVFFSSENEEKR